MVYTNKMYGKTMEKSSFAHYFVLISWHQLPQAICVPIFIVNKSCIYHVRFKFVLFDFG